MKRLLSVAAVTFVLAGGALTATAVPAWAACTDRVCVYQLANGGGTAAGFTTADNNFSNNRFADGSNVNDRISSMSCTTTRRPIFYTDSYWRGQGQRVFCDGQAENAVWDNQFSSFYYAID